MLDDCLASKGSWMKDPNITELFYNARHYGLTLIITMQFPLGIPPELRCNFDYIFLAREDYHSNLKRLRDHYCGMFPSLDIFKQTFAQLTDDYGLMVVKNNGSVSQITDKIFYFKSKL